MERPTAIFLASALCCAAACESSTPQKTEPAKAEPQETEPQKTTPAASEAKAPTPETAEPPPTPAWFDAAKIQHAAVLNEMASQGAVAGGQAWAMVLELEAGVSNQQCIDRAKATIGESLPDVPEPIASDDGRLTIQGKTDDYHYTVVCGEAKGKPTMYLSYTTK